MSLGAGAAFAPAFFGDWKCHVCGDLRPDAEIAVYSLGFGFGRGGSYKVNIRHCADRAECREKAMVLAQEQLTRFADRLLEEGQKPATQPEGAGQ